MAERKQINYYQRLLALSRAGLGEHAAIQRRETDELGLMPLEERVSLVLKLSERVKTDAGKMTYFVMYDIAHNKVRSYMAKFLLQKGCLRVQKSIFLANSDRLIFDEIYTALREVQGAYQNEDSIFMVPVSQDQLSSMKIIGQKIQVDIVNENRSTLFF